MLPLPDSPPALVAAGGLASRAGWFCRRTRGCPHPGCPCGVAIPRSVAASLGDGRGEPGPGLAVGLVVPRTAVAPPEPPLAPPLSLLLAPVPVAPAASSGASAVQYRVQPGDSSWRIAAALLGDGRRWREVVAGREDRQLRAGDTVELRLSRQ